MHIGVFGISEEQHREIQKLRRDFESLVAYLEEQRVAAALNHLFRGFRAGLDVGEYLAPLVGRFGLFETRNGTQSARYRDLTERAIAAFRSAGPPGETAGSDAHTLLRIGRTWTECPGGSREEFLENLRAGLGRARGADGRLLPLARDVYSVILSYYGTLVGRGRVKFASGERWPGVLFCLATLPSQFIAFPFLATSWNLSMKRLGIARIGWALGSLDRAAIDAPAPEAGAEADLCPEVE